MINKYMDKDDLIMAVLQQYLFLEEEDNKYAGFFNEKSRKYYEEINNLNICGTKDRVGKAILEYYRDYLVMIPKLRWKNEKDRATLATELDRIFYHNPNRNLILIVLLKILEKKGIFC